MAYSTPACIAEYRPIALSPRHDGWTEVRQYRFLFALAETGNVSTACAEAGLSRRAAYRLRAHPKGAAFAAAWDAALDHQLAEWMETMERELDTRLRSDRSLGHLLRFHFPERFADD